MTETLVPLGRGGLDAERRLAVGGGRRATKRDGVESAMTSTVKKDFLRGRVLNKEKETVKLHKNIIIKNETINGEKMLMNMWETKNIS